MFVAEQHQLKSLKSCLNRGPIGGLLGDPSWVQSFKENKIKEILAQNGLLEFFRAISLLITTLPTFLS